MRNLIHFIPVMVAIVAATPVFGSTVVPAGNVSGTWTADGSPYLVEGNVTISESDVLNIEPGVAVIFQEHCGLVVEGALQAVGAAQDSVTFTAASTEAGWNGIAIAESAAPTRLDHCVVEYGTGTAADQWGGGISCRSPLLTLSHSRISNSHADLNGGGVYLWDSAGTASISDCTISNNTAELNGGGLYLVGREIELAGCLIENNQVTGNDVNHGRGGGVFCVGWFIGSVEITGCNFRRNQGPRDGGGLHVEGALNGGVHIGDCDFVDNRCALGNGVGIHLSGLASAVTVTGCSFMENWTYSGGKGGALFSQCTGDLTLSRCTFGHNFSWQGGTVYCTGSGNIDIEFCTFSHNYDNTEPFAGALLLDTDATVINTMFCNQSSNLCGVSPGINFYSGTHSVRHCDFYNNVHGGNFIGTTPTGLGDLATVNANGDSCDVYANIFRNPLLCGAPADLTVAEISPCLGAGEAGADIGALGIGCEFIGVPTHQPSGPHHLAQNYPNPFNPGTSFEINVPRAGHVRVRVFGLRGELIATLLDETLDRGARTVPWNGTDDRGRAVESGVYLYRLQMAGLVETRSMVLLR